MIYYTERLSPEISNLEIADVTLIYQAIHNAIADNLDFIEIRLNYFRDGETLHVTKVDYMDLYKMLQQIV